MSTLLAVSTLTMACNNTNKVDNSINSGGISSSAFDTVIDGQSVYLYHIGNDKINVSFTNYGARMVTLEVPDRNGVPVDVILGYDSVEEFKENASNFYGAIVGRYGNRIGQAQFTLNGQTYELEKNDGENSLHGGKNGLFDKVWEVADTSATSVTFTYFSPDGESGYPGNVNIKVTYSVNEGGGLLIDYHAETDKETVLNLTNHAYFNLNGAGDASILDHELWIDADTITEVNQDLIPTGKGLAVKESPFDFMTPKLIGEHIDQENTQLKIGNGYDHNFQLIKRGDFNEIARVYSSKTGIEMRVLTTEPGLQFYSGNFMAGSDAKGKGGQTYPFRSAFCLETQHYPDSPNHSTFPSTVLKPGDTYSTRTEYRFVTR